MGKQEAAENKLIKRDAKRTNKAETAAILEQERQMTQMLVSPFVSQLRLHRITVNKQLEAGVRLLTIKEMKLFGSLNPHLRLPTAASKAEMWQIVLQALKDRKSDV